METTTVDAARFTLRAALTKDGIIRWVCRHTHYSRDDALACAAGHLESVMEGQ